MGSEMCIRDSYHTGSIRYFQQSYLRYQRYPGILRFRYLTISAPLGIFNRRTHDTHAYPGMEYPGYIPGVCRVRYLTHGLCEMLDTVQMTAAKKALGYSNTTRNLTLRVELEMYPLFNVKTTTTHFKQRHEKIKKTIWRKRIWRERDCQP